MATPIINLSILEFFSPILMWLLIFALLYGLFQWAKILGDNKILHAVIAAIFSIFVTILSPGSAAMVRFMIPWFTVLGIFIVFSIMLYKIFGATDADVRSVITSRSDIQWTLFIIIVIIILGALSQSFGQRQLLLTNGEQANITGVNVGRPDSSETGTNDFNQNLAATFYHPKVLGMLLLFIIAALAVATLSRPIVKG